VRYYDHQSLHKVVEAMLAKSSQDQEQCQRIVDMYESLAQALADTGVRQ
jgi:hypothetical protein